MRVARENGAGARLVQITSIQVFAHASFGIAGDEQI
jgi:hypothetical protein